MWKFLALLKAKFYFQMYICNFLFFQKCTMVSISYGIGSSYIKGGVSPFGVGGYL